MEAMRATWTDERMDDLKEEVVRIRADLVSVRAEIVGVRGEIVAQGERIDSLNHTILMVGGGIFAGFLTFLAALVGLIITQL
jgi:hypothetical protein